MKKEKEIQRQAFRIVEKPKIISHVDVKHGDSNTLMCQRQHKLKSFNQSKDTVVKCFICLDLITNSYFSCGYKNCQGNFCQKCIGCPACSGLMDYVGENPYNEKEYENIVCDKCNNTIPNEAIRKFGAWHCPQDETDIGICCLSHFETIDLRAKRAKTRKRCLHVLLFVLIGLLLTAAIIIAIYYTHS